MIASRLSAVLVVGLPLLYAGCGSNLTLPGEGEPAHIAVTSGNGQKLAVGSQLAPLVVKVTDTQGRAVSGVTVDFTFDDAATDATLQPASHATDASGQASTTVTLGSHVGVVNGHATVSGSPSATPVQAAFTATALSGDASTVQVVSGDGQSGPVGSTLSQPLVVKVTDASGNPIPGITITWTVDGGGSVSETSTVTGDDGQTQVTRKLGNAVGHPTTTATAEALSGSPSVTFSHEATAGSAARVEKISGDGQGGAPGSELPNPLVVRVLDAQNNPVAGRAVTWVIGLGGGHPNPVNTVTDADGKASTRWTLGSSPGTNTINAVASGAGDPVTFTATGSAGSVSASNSTVTASPGSITAGASTSTITVRVKDANGTPVSGVSVSVTSSGTGNQIDPASATSNDNGIATFTFGSTVGEDKTITAVAGGVTLDQKPSITVNKAESRTRITGQNLSTPSTAGQPVHVTFTVTSRDGVGTPTGQVTVTSDIEPTASCTADVSVGSCDITLTVVGDHDLIATYSGDSRFGGGNDDRHHQVAPGPQAPVANPDTYNTPGAGAPLIVSAPGVLTNDTGTGPLTAQAVTQPTQGTLALSSDGSFTYTLFPTAAGQDSFTYAASNGTLTSSPATVTINITP